MAKEAIVQVRMDSDIKEHAEAIYRSIGTSFSEAVRVFAMQSIYANGYPFQPHILKKTAPSTRGSLHRYANPTLRTLENNAFLEAMQRKHLSIDTATSDNAEHDASNDA